MVDGAVKKKKEPESYASCKRFGIGKYNICLNIFIQ